MDSAYKPPRPARCASSHAGFARAADFFRSAKKRRGPPFGRPRPVFSFVRATPYLLQLAHSAHLPLQHVAQSLSLQHSGQLEPAAWTDATAATNANAMAVINDFIIFFPFRFGNLERDHLANKYSARCGAESGQVSRRRHGRLRPALGSRFVEKTPTKVGGRSGRQGKRISQGLEQLGGRRHRTCRARARGFPRRIPASLRSFAATIGL